MATHLKTRKAAAKPATTIDPIFAAIAEHKLREREWSRALMELDDAEHKVRGKYQSRPDEWSKWRTGIASDKKELDYYRENFLSEPGADPKQIEKEYQDAISQLLAAKHSCLAWDYRTGTAPLREKCNAAKRAAKQAATKLARTKPATAAGAGALIAYIQHDIEENSPEDWQLAALKTVAVSLTRMNREAA